MSCARSAAQHVTPSKLSRRSATPVYVLKLSVLTWKHAWQLSTTPKRRAGRRVHSTASKLLHPPIPHLYPSCTCFFATYFYRRTLGGIITKHALHTHCYTCSTKVASILSTVLFFLYLFDTSLCFQRFVMLASLAHTSLDEWCRFGHLHLPALYPYLFSLPMHTPYPHTLSPLHLLLPLLS